MGVLATRRPNAGENSREIVVDNDLLSLSGDLALALGDGAPGPERPGPEASPDLTGSLQPLADPATGGSPAWAVGPWGVEGPRGSVDDELFAWAAGGTALPRSAWGDDLFWGDWEAALGEIYSAGRGGC
jgi:hypothetical protein